MRITTFFCLLRQPPGDLLQIYHVLVFPQILRLLRTSLRLIETWEYPSQAFSGAFLNSLGPNAITDKLSDLKMGVNVLIGVRPVNIEVQMFL